MATDVLVIEDSSTQALRLKLILERDGFKVSVASTGCEGLKLAPLIVPVAVVLDINLPDIDGYHVCEALKDHPVTAETPVVMLTVKDEAIDTLNGLDAGADAYIPKDEFAETNLLQTLRDLGL